MENAIEQVLKAQEMSFLNVYCESTTGMFHVELILLAADADADKLTVASGEGPTIDDAFEILDEKVEQQLRECAAGAFWFNVLEEEESKERLSTGEGE